MRICADEFIDVNVYDPFEIMFNLAVKHVCGISLDDVFVIVNDHVFIVDVIINAFIWAIVVNDVNLINALAEVVRAEFINKKLVFAACDESKKLLFSGFVPNIVLCFENAWPYFDVA